MNFLRNFIWSGLLLAAVSAPAQANAGPPCPVIMLDPGHGGTNLGAYGKAVRSHEKTLTLKICRQAAVALKKLRPSWRVLFTRMDDRYLTLNQRVRMANKAGAGLFISVHLNASPAASQRGFETYILSRKASDSEAARVAAGENRQSTARGAKRKGAVVAQILGDLRQTAAHAGSLKLAKLIQHELTAAWGKELNRGVRQAPFDVLLGLHMPGVLLEAGFIDHPEEGPRMAGKSAQRDAGRAIARGVIAYLEGGRPSKP